MKLILHIGTPRTGATVIQNTLDANPDWLAAHGLGYGKVLAPGTDHSPITVAAARLGHPVLKALGIRSDEDRAQLREKVSDWIRWHHTQLDAAQHTTLMSSAHILRDLRHKDEIETVRDLLLQHYDAVKIVVYVRRQDDAILSLYTQHLRAGRCDDVFRDFVDTCLGADSPAPYLYYRRELGKWVDVWGRDAIVLRRFSAADFIDGSLLADFLGIVLNTWSPDLEGLEPVPGDHAPLSAPAIELLRRMQPHVVGDDGTMAQDRQARLLAWLNALPAHPRPVMAAATSRQIMQHFEQANLWLKETFYPELEGPFFPHRPDHPERGNLGQVTAHQLGDVAGQLVARALGS